MSLASQHGLTAEDAQWLAPIASVLGLDSRGLSAKNHALPIREWLESDYYTGHLRRHLFDFWKQHVFDFFDHRDKLTELVLTGALSTGKSTVANVVWVRFLYELSCLESPQLAFNMLPTDEIYLAYLSVSLKQADETGFGAFRNLVDSIPYFRDQFPRNRKLSSVLEFPSGIRFIAGSDVDQTIGHNLISMVLDEANFLKRGGGNMGDVSKAMGIYQESRQRMLGRFLADDKAFPGLMVIVSSATSRSSFTEQIIQEKAPTTKVVRGALWDVKPPKTFTRKKFFFFAGSDTKNPQILDEAADWSRSLGVEAFERESAEEIFARLNPNQSQYVIQVPDDPQLRENFRRFPMASLMNLAGRSAVPQGKFFTSREHFAMCLDDTLLHPFDRETVELALSNEKQLVDYMLPDVMFLRGDGKVKPRHAPQAPRFLHIDQSVSRDDFGISCAHVEGVVDTPVGMLPLVVYDFQLRITPPPAPDKIALGKIPRFIKDLRSMGLVVGKITFDSFQSESNLQELTLAGFVVGRRSVDRDDTPWLDWSNGAYNRAIRLYRYKPFETELFELDHDRARHKVDHPARFGDGSVGDKAVADASIGAYANAIEASVGLQKQATHQAVLSRVVQQSFTPQGGLTTGLTPRGVTGLRTAGGKFKSLIQAGVEANKGKT